MSDAVNQIQQAMSENKTLFGTRSIKKNLPKIQKVYLTKNCGEQTVEDMKYYATLAKLDIETLTISNEELSIMCKKPFLINVVSILQ
jgi:ribosomal protein L30E